MVSVSTSGQASQSLRAVSPEISRGHGCKATSLQARLRRPRPSALRADRPQSQEHRVA